MLYPVNTYEEAADKALRLAHTIFLTTGSKTASIFVQAARGQAKRLIFRILPDPEGIHHLLQQGVAIGDIVAMQGPFAVSYTHLDVYKRQTVYSRRITQSQL